MNIPVNTIVNKINDFAAKYGVAPNTILVGPDQPKDLVKSKMVLGMNVIICDDLNIEVALL